MRGRGHIVANKTSSGVVANLIEIRVSDVAQLFHTLDPPRFREKNG
jgi:hypothetical protein